MLRLVRTGLILAVLAAGYFLAGPHRRVQGVALAAVGLLILFLLVLLVSRLAHASFEAGRHGQAALLYRVLKIFTPEPSTRAAIDVSLAGCLLGRDDFAAALAALDRIDPAVLAPSARAAWLNNRAYARARADREAHDALRDVDDAMKLRPDVAGYRHTRGIVLLALGRVDDAIADLESIWPHLAAEKAPSPLLEAERCYDLGMAWARKGELDYARDYFLRSRSTAPGSTWSARATEWLTRHPARSADVP
jgi:tetratricopeptide (TPR) repeat protein